MARVNTECKRASQAEARIEAATIRPATGATSRTPTTFANKLAGYLHDPHLREALTTAKRRVRQLEQGKVHHQSIVWYRLLSEVWWFR